MNLPKTVDVIAYFKPESEIRLYRFRIIMMLRKIHILSLDARFYYISVEDIWI